VSVVRFRPRPPSLNLKRFQTVPNFSKKPLSVRDLTRKSVSSGPAESQFVVCLQGPFCVPQTVFTAVNFLGYFVAKLNDSLIKATPQGDKEYILADRRWPVPSGAANR